MEFHQLTYFLAAAQTQNFRKAAELCIVAQSALSRQIAALEKELEVSLFTRQKQRVIFKRDGQTGCWCDFDTSRIDSAFSDWE